MNTKLRLCAYCAIGTWLVPLTAYSQVTTLSDLFRGGTITAVDKVFSNFTLVTTTTTNGGSANTALIDVTPLIDDALNPGIKFTAPLDALGTPFGHQGASTVQLKFSFDVATSSQLPLIKDTSLLINGFTFDSGPLANIQISEQVFDSTNALLGTNVAVANSSSSVGDGSLTSSFSFTPKAFVHVVKQIDIVGPGDNDGAFLLSFQQRFSEVVPEPCSLTLVGCFIAMAGLAAPTRRRCK